MRFALMHDNMAISSYYIKDKTAYAFKNGMFNGYKAEMDKPYVYHHSISAQCYIAMQNLPFLYNEDGCYLNLAEWNTLPDTNFDLIFYGCEKNWNEDGSIKRKSVSAKEIKNKYSNAKVLGWIKELHVGNHIQSLKRVEELNSFDGVITSGASSFKKLLFFE